MRAATLGITYALFATSLSGCFGGCGFWDDDWDDDWDDECVGSECETFAPPTISISIPEWPPLGPEGEVTIVATGEAGLVEAEFSFAETAWFELYGGQTEEFRVTGLDLGEGFGTLEIKVVGEDGGWTRREVDDLLVDLSPPEAYFTQTVLPAAGATLDFWIADAWVVSSYSLTVGEETFEATLPEGYPSTLGTEWDYSFVRIPVEDLPLGVVPSALTVRDAAGNLAHLDLTITVDGVAPKAAFAAPIEGATVGATFDVTIDAADDLGGAVEIELSAGGAVLATLIGPSATVTLDASELPAGPIELSVVAIDQAGNRSEATVRTVTVAAPD